MGRTEGPVLVLAAVAEELVPCRRALADAGPPCGFAALGVGAVEVAVALGESALDQRWSSVWMVGTVGAYPGSPFGPGDVVAVDRFLWAAPEAIAGRAYLPDPVAREARPPSPRRWPEGLPRVVSATVPAITTDLLAGRAVRAETGADVEHLELFAAAMWAERHGLPFGGVVAITNRVGPGAHAEWLEWRLRAEAAAGDALARHLIRPDREAGPGGVRPM